MALLVESMKLCAIYSIWDDWDLLKISVQNISKVVDGVIIVWSENSNYGEMSKPKVITLWEEYPYKTEFFTYQHEPSLHHPQHAETRKRNYGLAQAKALGFTHFITMDSDEFYDRYEFIAAKKYLNDNPHLNGLVVESQVYFKSPTLTIGKDVTLVPHIHKLTPTIKHEFNKNYPFAWINGQIRIDPTRSFNINSGVEMFDCTMHHMSWIRSDYEKKIRNSTARANLTKSSIVHDLVNAQEGEMCHFYGKRLLRVANRFNIPEYGEEGIRTLA
jgi:hypothetical protein